MGEDVTTQTGSKLSVREQLLLAQAVYQVQSSKQAKETIDWEQVNELLNGYQQARKDEDWLAGTSFNPTVCSIAYLDICKTYLEKNQDHQSHLIDTSQTLAVARQLYETHLKSIAAALLEEEKKSQNLQSEIEAIERGEWDDKLKAVTEPKDPTSRKSTPVQSPIKPLDSHPSPSHHEAVSNAEGSEVDKQSLVGDSLTAPVSGRHPHGKKSPISRSKRGAKKEKDAANSTKTHSEDNDVSLGTVPESTGPYAYVSTHIIVFIDEITDLLSNTIKGDGNQYPPALRNACRVGLQLTNKYYTLTDCSPLFQVAMVLHPLFKDEYFKIAGWEDDWIVKALRLTRDMFNTYYKPSTTASTGTNPHKGSTKPKTGNIAQLGAALAAPGHSTNDPLENWLASGLRLDDGSPIDALKWWIQQKQAGNTHGGLLQMALDVLSCPGKCFLLTERFI
ncbi:hypothetical protein PSTG_06422 [Puccinia striiformis f. sp. tritici PST-78]|uniref:HAT C-terminal dimerisation domain-containing protein n=1 Tax=Puccinia striiformis f. sp. tritici PST-78 TaxID=1165861 RepID=A0A0L0VLT4_9BASI|nr:hypothetical protein PSTG_06422 [Puccinia striiformis f. sp. tritici PST-78]